VRSVRSVEVVRLGFPSERDDTVVGEGQDIETRERVHFIVPPGQRLRVLAEAHAGRRSVLKLHSFDVVPWSDILGIEWDESGR
jgi:hypothetical protein